MPPSASSNRPTRRRSAPGERPLLVPEELALGEALGDGAAVERDERPAGAAGRGGAAPARPAPCRSRSRREPGRSRSVGATRSIRSRTSAIPGDTPTSASSGALSKASSRSTWFSRSRRATRPARRTGSSTRSRRLRRTSGWNGFSMKSSAPRRIASTARSTEPNAVMATMRRAGLACRAAATRSRPLPSPRRMSVSSRSKAPSASRRRPVRRSAARATSCPSRSTVRPRESRTDGSSSTIRMRATSSSPRRPRAATSM